MRPGASGGVVIDPGTVFLLNGTTSAGKTSIAKALQARCPELVLHLGIDMFVAEVMPRAYLGGERGAEGFRFVPIEGSEPSMVELVFGPAGEQVIAALHQTVALQASRGLHVVVDHTLMDRRWLAECVALWRGLPVLFVGVRCPWEVVEQRLRGGAERPAAAAELFTNVARWQYERVHAHGGSYDLELDTSQASPETCAEAIERVWREGPPPTAFLRLAAELDAGA